MSEYDLGIVYRQGIRHGKLTPSLGFSCIRSTRSLNSTATLCSGVVVIFGVFRIKCYKVFIQLLLYNTCKELTDPHTPIVEL